MHNETSCDTQAHTTFITHYSWLAILACYFIRVFIKSCFLVLKLHVKLYNIYTAVPVAKKQTYC